MSTLPGEDTCAEVENFDVLDDLLVPADGSDSSSRTQPVPSVTLFTGGDVAALYRDGSLIDSGDVSDLAVRALVILGADVYTGAEHLLGSTDGVPATDLATIEERAGALERVVDLREQAAALRAQAEALENEAAS